MFIMCVCIYNVHIHTHYKQGDIILLSLSLRLGFVLPHFMKELSWTAYFKKGPLALSSDAKASTVVIFEWMDILCFLILSL